ncbi:MAG: glycosyltransferase [Proteobacteria bacterium]|nr:glycosyltransferase [Pseudomonadota bacterium]
MTGGAATPRWVAGAATPPPEPYDADVVILMLDRFEETLAAVRSALAQDGVSLHVCVLDQGSAPSTLTRMAEALAGEDRATLLASACNLGVAAGRNAASAFGHGRVIVGLDNDAVFGAADTVASLVAALDAEPRLAAVGCRIVAYDTGSDDRSSWGYPPAPLTCAGESFDAITFVGAGHAIRRAAWAEAGGYDGALFFCWEEFDFCLRAIALGWRVRYRGDIVVRHRVSGERRVAWASDRWFYFVRNRLYIERKLGTRWPALLPRVLGYWMKSARHGLAAETLRAVIAAERMSPGRRRAIPQAALSYISRNDRRLRGSLFTRLRKEVFSRLLTVASPAAE